MCEYWQNSPKDIDYDHLWQANLLNSGWPKKVISIVHVCVCRYNTNQHAKWWNRFDIQTQRIVCIRSFGVYIQAGWSSKPNREDEYAPHTSKTKQILWICIVIYWIKVYLTPFCNVAWSATSEPIFDQAVSVSWLSLTDVFIVRIDELRRWNRNSEFDDVGIWWLRNLITSESDDVGVRWIRK